MTCSFFQRTCGCGRGRCNATSPPKKIFGDMIDEFCGSENWRECLTYRGRMSLEY